MIFQKSIFFFQLIKFYNFRQISPSISAICCDYLQITGKFPSFRIMLNILLYFPFLCNVY